ncbi:EAL domain-containing protein, partial [bacterium]|nr:EAL domain-containing protein [bacterium]
KLSHQNTIKYIQSTANQCNIKTIAKSVENANTLAMLWNIGVDAVQGYFIQEPHDKMCFNIALQ